MSKKNSKRGKQTDPELNLLEQDENFYFIAGYTSWGFPYGITWEEAAEHGLLDENDNDSDEPESPDDLPF